MKLAPEASMRMRASPGAGVGVGRSRRVRTSAEQVVRIWMACMWMPEYITGVKVWRRAEDVIILQKVEAGGGCEAFRRSHSSKIEISDSSCRQMFARLVFESNFFCAP